MREAELFNDEGKFKIRLESYIKNTGRMLPQDSHPSYYNDHYDSAIKLKQATTFDDQSIYEFLKVSNIKSTNDMEDY